MKLIAAAEKDLSSNTVAPFCKQIIEDISELAKDPKAKSNTQAILGKRGFYRRRTGNFRTTYEIDHEKQEITIWMVRRRNEDTYKALKRRLLS